MPTTKRSPCPLLKPRASPCATQADHCFRVGCGPNCRSARRKLLCRETNPRHGERAPSITSRNSTRWAAWSKRSNADTRRRKSPRPVTNTSAPWKPTKRSQSAVNDFVIEEESPNILYIGESVARAQEKSSGLAPPAVQTKTFAPSRGSETRRREDSHRRRQRQHFRSQYHALIVNAVRAYATVGEICEALRQVYGTYTEVSIT